MAQCVGESALLLTHAAALHQILELLATGADENGRAAADRNKDLGINRPLLGNVEELISPVLVLGIAAI